MTEYESSVSYLGTPRGMKTYHSIKCDDLKNYLNIFNDEIHVLCLLETFLTTKLKPYRFNSYQTPIIKIRKNTTKGNCLCIYIK